MTKKDFQKKIPDVRVQPMKTSVVLSRADIEQCVLGLVKALDTGLLYYWYDGRIVKIFTSDKMKIELDKMIPGYEVLNQNTGKIGCVVSEKPYVMSCQMCVTVDFDGNKEAYDCDFFI